MTEMLSALFLTLSYYNPQYKAPFEASVDANYKNSDLKKYVDSGTDMIKKEFPEAFSITSLGYGIGIKKEVQFKTSKILPVENTQTFFAGNKNEAKIEFRFGI